jgi:type IV pilus assembly protein PilV
MMLEALVGILIFTIGVLGFVGLQASMVKAQSSANYRAEAAQLATDIVGRMWVDVDNVAAYTSSAGCKANALCNEWLTRVAARLPGGVAPTITRTGDQYDITIHWVVPGDTDTGGAHRYRTSTSVTPQPTKGAAAPSP